MINLLIITHEAVGEAYRSLTHHFFPMGMPENIRILGVEPDEDQTDIINNAIAALQEFRKPRRIDYDRHLRRNAVQRCPQASSCGQIRHPDRTERADDD